MLDGRVKTLHPAIHAGILAARRDLATHQAALNKHGLAEIDLVVSNLYPFEATVESGAGWDDCIENIDIGGPSLIRGSAKNHDFVTIVTDPVDYDAVVAEMDANGGATTLATRRRLAGPRLCPDCGVRFRHRQLDGRPARRYPARNGDDRRQAYPSAALRRESTPEGRVLRAFVPSPDQVSRPPASYRARNSATTTSTTPTRPLNASRSSMSLPS